MSDGLREDVLEERLREMTVHCVQAEAALAAKDDEIARLREEIARVRAQNQRLCRALRGEEEVGK